MLDDKQVTKALEISPENKILCVTHGAIMKAVTAKEIVEVPPYENTYKLLGYE